MQQADIANHNVVAQRFGHVVHGQCGGGNGGQRLHFHAGFMGDAHFGTDVQAAFILLILQKQFAAFQHHRMAERNNAGGIFGGHNAGNAGNLGNRAFGRLPVRRLNLRVHFVRKIDRAIGNGNAFGDGFVGHVHHVRVSV